MKAVLLAGGKGIHFPGTGKTIPKAMVKIGETPFMCHIMKMLASYGVNDFIVAAGRQQYEMKKYFLDFYAHQNDILIDLSSNEFEIDESSRVNWKVRVCDTGHETKTGGRIKRLAKYLEKNEPFIMVYGDTIADVDINLLLDNHKKSGKKATITVYNASQRFGVVELGENGTVKGFRRQSDQSSFVNIGFMVLEPSVLDLIEGDETVLEKYPLEELARQKDLNSYVHRGYYIKMDKINDLEELNALYESGCAPWESL